MILSPKLFIDTCVAKPIGDRVLLNYKAIYPSITITHLTEVYRQSRCDSVWIRGVAEQGGWIVITSDRGKDSLRPCLPELCRAYGVTCVAMTPKLAQQGVRMHQEVVTEIVRNIEVIYKAPPGTVISIGQIQEKGGIIKFGFRVNQKGKAQVSLGTFLQCCN